MMFGNEELGDGDILWQLARESVEGSGEEKWP